MTETNNADASREQFEAWVSAEPFCERIERYPNNPELFAWPGEYKCLKTALAWDAWQEGVKFGDKCREGCKIKRWVKEAQDSLTDDY